MRLSCTCERDKTIRYFIQWNCSYLYMQNKFNVAGATGAESFIKTRIRFKHSYVGGTGKHILLTC
jgi:hypothetical protein